MKRFLLLRKIIKKITKKCGQRISGVVSYNTVTVSYTKVTGLFRQSLWGVLL